MAATPLRNIRVDDELWEAFGEATTAIGSTRTEVLVALMRRYVNAMSVPVPDRTADPDQAREVSSSRA